MAKKFNRRPKRRNLRLMSFDRSAISGPLAKFEPIPKCGQEVRIYGCESTKCTPIKWLSTSNYH